MIHCSAVLMAHSRVKHSVISVLSDLYVAGGPVVRKHLAEGLLVELPVSRHIDVQVVC